MHSALRFILIHILVFVQHFRTAECLTLLISLQICAALKKVLQELLYSKNTLWTDAAHADIAVIPQVLIYASTSCRKYLEYGALLEDNRSMNFTMLSILSVKQS